MKTYLFIGGVADGRRIKTDGKVIVLVRVESHLFKPFRLYDETYVLRRFLSGHEIYVHDHLSDESVIELLIERYPKQP